ncbi:MAG: LPXTG cell wall anchor domain-containing protein [Candidatus Ornithomonoglobus sp.]
MRKIYLCAAAAGVMSVVIASQVFAASNCSVTAKSNSKSVTLTYPSGSYTEFTQDADNLFKGFSSASANAYTEDTLTVTSNSKAGIRVDVLLRLTLDSVTETEYSPLDYYSFIISDNNGDLVYSSAEDAVSEPSATIKEIYLGEFNSSFTSDTKTYNVQYKVSDAGKNLSKDDISGLGLELVAEPLQITVEDSGNTVVAAAESTEAPTAPADIVQTAATEAPEKTEPAATPEPTESAEKTIVIGQSKDKDGNVITAGRYVMKGNALVSIKDKDGKLKATECIIDGLADGVEGVSQLIVTLEDGDVITIKPIDGQTKAPISLEKTNVSSATEKPSGSKATEKPAVTASSKSSPKTGDNGMALGMLGGIMAVAAAGFGGLGIIKRRKTN